MEKVIKKNNLLKFKTKNCSHRRAYSFHENAPMYCPTCECYLDGNEIKKKSVKYILLERRKKINKILLNIKL